MKVEMIDIYFRRKEIKHYSSSGVKKIKLKKSSDDGISEGISYVENYISQYGYQIINCNYSFADLLNYHIAKG
ncbi:MAG: hypothetical protein ACXACP_09070 [Candidatus Hodarchaeales archaeon]